ncbi:MAG: hypothetical protein M5R40_06885 [Anaerolineae bacterium]|nr:hypothetical protein [Anaerolineae bacterium]
MIEALLTSRSDPAFSDGIGVRRLEWGVDDLHILGDEDGIEGICELAVMVVDEEADGRVTVSQLPVS